MKTFLKAQLFILVVFIAPAFGQETFNILTHTLWNYSVERAYPSFVPLIDGNSIFIGTDRSPVVCLDKRTGKEKWKLDINLSDYPKGFIHPIQADKKGNIYFNGTSKDIFAVEKLTGKLLWKYEAKFDDDFFSRITVVGDTIFVNPCEAVFLAISTTGKLLWKARLDSYCQAYSVDEQKVYCQLMNGELCVLDKGSGRKISSTKLFAASYKFEFPQVINHNNTIILSNTRDSIVCLDKTTLKAKWSLNNAKNLCIDNNSVYAYNDSTFYRINPINGKILWSISDNFNWQLYPTEYNLTLYLQTRRKFFIVNNVTGELLYLSKFPDKSYSKPIIENGIIYIGFSGMYMATRAPEKNN